MSRLQWLVDAVTLTLFKLGVLLILVGAVFIVGVALGYWQIGRWKVVLLVTVVVFFVISAIGALGQLLGISGPRSAY